MKIERILWMLAVVIAGVSVFFWQQRSFPAKCAIVVDEQLDAARASSTAPVGTETGTFIRADLANSRIYIGIPQQLTVGTDTYVSTVEQEMDFDPNALLINGGNFSGGPEVLSEIIPGQTISYIRIRTAGENGLDRVETIYVPLP